MGLFAHFVLILSQVVRSVIVDHLDALNVVMVIRKYRNLNANFVLKRLMDVIFAQPSVCFVKFALKLMCEFLDMNVFLVHHTFKTVEFVPRFLKSALLVIMDI